MKHASLVFALACATLVHAALRIYDGAADGEVNSLREVGTMTSPDDVRPIPVRVLLDGKTARNITLTCLAPREERPINYRDTLIAYKRVLDDNGKEQDLGENNYPEIGATADVLEDGKEFGVYWTLFNIQQSDAGVYYCDLRKRRKTTVASVAFQLIVVEPPKSVKFVSTASAKVGTHSVQVKDRMPYHLKCEIEGGMPHLKAELVIDGGTRRDARNYTDEERGVTVIEETGIMLHADLVKVSCVVTVSESNDFDRADSTLLKRITKDEKYLQVHYAPHVVECIAESHNGTVSNEFHRSKSDVDHFVLALATRPDAVVCFVRADPDLDEVYWLVGPDNDTLRDGDRHHHLNMKATVAKKHEAKMHKNITIYEARLHLGNSSQHPLGSSYTLKAHSQVANVGAVVRLHERTSAMEETAHGALVSPSRGLLCCIPAPFTLLLLVSSIARCLSS